MKRMFLVLSLVFVLFIAGCIGSGMIWKVYDNQGRCIKSLEVANLKGMVNTSTKSLAMNVTDGNDFSAKLLIIDSNVVASPESATALGDAVSNVMTGGASGVASELIK